MARAKGQAPEKDGAGKAAPASGVQKWITTISAYEREFKKWEGRAEKIVRIYRDHDQQSDTRTANQTTFNILWSNVQTCLPATFARLPKPDVSRRFRDNDPIGRVAALILERALEFEIDHYPDYRAAMENSVLDRFLGGRGVSWVRYEPHFRAAEHGMPEDGVMVTEDADEAEATPEAEEVIDYECAPVDYVHWKDFGHTIARTWEEVTAVWRRVYMTRPALCERFGEKLGNTIPLDTKPEEQKRSSTDTENYQACIYEIWDKATNKAYWLSKSMPDMLDEKDDPMQLEGFFPCPRPLFSTVTTDSLVPVPDYKLYQDQASELNVLADRIDGLIKALRVRGIYDASQPALARLFTEGDNNTLIPAQNWSAFAEKQGLKGSIDLVDLAPIVQALNESYAAMEQVKNQIYEVMGISDIIRGSSDPNETATAVATKGQYGSMRLRAMQSKVGQFATEILQIKAQIMCKWFQPQTLVAISGVDQLSDADKQLVPQAMVLLLGERATNPEAESSAATLRDFRIEVSADSMVQMDEQQEKQDRMEFLKAVGAFFQQAAQAVEQAPQMAPIMASMLKFGITAYKVGKGIEGDLDQAIDQLKAQAAQPQQPKPDPEAMKAQTEQAKIQAQSQADAQQAQLQNQLETQRMQMEERLEQQRQQAEAALEAHKQQLQAEQIAQQNQLEAQRDALKAHNDAALEQMRQQHDTAMESSRQTLELILARLDHATKIEVAEVTAGATIQKAEIAAANSAAKDDSIQGVQDGQPTPKPTPEPQQ
jgi:hypothetical protein